MKKIISLCLFLAFLAAGCGLPYTSGSSNSSSSGTGSSSVAAPSPQPNPGDTSQTGGNPPAATTHPPSASTAPDAGQTPAANPQPVIANPPPGAESVTPDTVVKEYYAALERKDYNDAWSFMHPSVHANPSGVLTQANFTADQKKWTAKLVQAQTIQLLDQYKIYSVQISFANVEVVKATFDDGQTKMIHLVLDEHNSWKMFWGPDGIE